MKCKMETSAISDSTYNMMDSNEEKINYKVIDAKKTGDFIRQLRKERGMTQDDLGEKIFISRKSISKWETGCCTPSIDMLKRLSEALGVSLEELLIGEFKENKALSKKELRNEIIMKVLKSRWFRISWVGIGIIVLALLAAVLISNINSDRIYLINHEGDIINIANGTITLSKGNSQMNVGEIFTELEGVTNDTKYKIDFYHKEDTGEEHLIVSFKDTLSIHLDDGVYRYLKKLFDKKDYDSLYFRLCFDGVDGKDYKYELNLKVVKKLATGGDDSEELQKQSEEEIKEVDLSFILNLSLDEIKKKYDNKKFKVEGVEWKVSYDTLGNTLVIVSNKKSSIYLTLTNLSFILTIEKNSMVFSVENRKINFENADEETISLVSKVMKKLKEQ